MKANSKFVNEEVAVSAVIGVILMVAITVAIAATVYVYMSGMLTSDSKKAPEISFLKDELKNEIMVTKISTNNVLHSDIVINSIEGTADWESPSAGYTFIQAGDKIVVTGWSNTDRCTFSVSYKNIQLYDTYTFVN